MSTRLDPATSPSSEPQISAALEAAARWQPTSYTDENGKILASFAPVEYNGIDRGTMEALMITKRVRVTVVVSEAVDLTFDETQVSEQKAIDEAGDFLLDCLRDQTESSRKIGMLAASATPTEDDPSYAVTATGEGYSVPDWDL
jgi:hypothetical protein